MFNNFRDFLSGKFIGKATGLAAAAVLFFAFSASASAAPLMYALNQSNAHLIAFRANTPSQIVKDLAIGGLGAGEKIGGMDFSLTGELFAIGFTPAGANQFNLRVLVINLLTGAATQRGATRLLPDTGAVRRFGVEFDPGSGLLQVTTYDARHYVINPSTGSLFIYPDNLAFVAGDPQAGNQPTVVQLAYANTLFGRAFFGIDYLTDKLVRIGGTGGVPSSDTGQLTTIGSLGIVTDGSEGGFDTDVTTNTLYAALRINLNSAGISRLYTINQLTGAASLIGDIGSGTNDIEGLAIAPSANRFDFVGSGKAQLGVFRPSNGGWYLYDLQNSTASSYLFGASGDLIAPADYDGDGKADLAVFRPSTGTWYRQLSNFGFSQIQFGAPGDLPMPADYSGDGKAEIAVFRPSTGTWYIYNNPNPIAFGLNGDTPTAGDYDGDTKADIAVFRPSNGTWYLLRSTAGFTQIQFGAAGDKAVPADYDGDGKTDLAVWRPTNGTWYLNQSQSGVVYTAFGINNDLPAPADFDGDGRADLGIFRPSSGTWYLQRSSQGFTAIQFGAGGDKPVPNAFVP